MESPHECTAELEENFQGPHDWRKRLKPINRDEIEDQSEDEDEKVEIELPIEKAIRDRRLSKDERLEDNKIREKLKSAWKKEVSDKKNRIPVIAKPSVVNGTSTPQFGIGNISPCLRKRKNILNNLESAFTRQVVNKPTSPGVLRKKQPNAVNPTRIPLPANDKRLNPHILSPLAGRRSSSSFTSADNISISPEAAARRVEKVMKARLYLLQQMGPNSFLIGGDSPDHKFRVIIGPQRCSCGRGHHCVHILFVMLRVFQVSENDVMLWSKELKNYEVESLVNRFLARRTQRIRDLKRKPKPQESKEESPESNSNESPVVSDHEESTKDEEETCPICLLEMVDGESLTECEIGCQNKYHHHCIAVWFVECRRQNDPLICPLCRTRWRIEEDGSESSRHDDLQAPPNTRASSPQNVSQDADLPLPQAEPIAPEHMDTATHWIPILGEELTSCLFSKNWSMRERALKQLGKVAQGSLMLGMGEGRSGVVLSPIRQATTHTMLECCCSVLAFMCTDPVYKVFVAGLRSLKTVLAYTPCRDEHQQVRLQTLLKPVVQSILWKCADCNKRTSQLSMSALQELVKGQEGELGIGTEIANPGHFDLGGVGYVVDCITAEFEIGRVQWQWFLGRLCMLDNLIDEQLEEFVVRPHDDDDEDQSSDEPYVNYDRVMSIIRFCKCGMEHTHAKVGKMARRVFYMISKLQVQHVDVFREISDLLNDLNMNMQVHMKRKLLRVAQELDAANQVSAVVANGQANELAQGVLLPYPTPVISATSTPRCASPVTPSPHITVVVNNFVSKGDLKFVPAVPPNSPRHRGRDSSITASYEVTDSESLGAVSVSTRSHSWDTGPDCDSGLFTPPSSPQRPRPIEPGAKLDLTAVEETESEVVLDPPEAVQRDLTLVEEKETKVYVDACVATSPSLAIRGLQPIVNDETTSTDEDLCDVPLSFLMENSYESHTAQAPETDEADSASLSFVRVDDDHDSVSVSSVRPNVNTPTGLLTEDLSDLTLSPSGMEERVTFKTEVTITPHQSPANGLSPSSSTECPCKEEVEEEEARALVAAMEKSSLSQDALPCVPGLTQSSDDETLIIHVQDEVDYDSGDNGNPQRYCEGREWLRGHMIGTGAFSTCYQARDVKTGTLMAVKQISFCRNSLSEQEKVIEAVREEIEMMAKLNHPNVVRIMGATQQGCHFFMFVEWMPGGSMAYLLDCYGAFTEHVIVNYILQILRGLAYLHDNHVLHRDLKGANILVDSTGHRIRIGDFGASARLASRATGAGEFQGQLLGTVAFMAPEVLRGECYGRSCDVWSVGCVIIEMATRRPPWGANDISNHLALIFKIASSVLPPPIPETLSPPVRDLTLRCLECRREERPPAKELLKHPLFTLYAKR